MTENMKRPRSTNFTNEEKLNLLTIIKEYKHIIENKESGVMSWKTKEDAWKAIERKFNSISSTFRSSDVLKRFYNNKKKETRKIAANFKEEMNMTGGGQLVKVKDDPVYNLTLDIINKKTVFGLTNKFDSDMQPSAASDISNREVERDIQLPEKDYIIEEEDNGIDGMEEVEIIVLQVNEGESMLETDKENTPKSISGQLKRKANWHSRRRPKMTNTENITLKYEEVADVKKEVMLANLEILKIQRAESDEKYQWERKQRQLREKREAEEFELKRKALLLDVKIKEAQLAALSSSY